MKSINHEELKAKIAEGKPLLVDFSAPWCNPCKVMAPVLHALAPALAGTVEMVMVDMDNELDAAVAFQVRAVPTFLVMRDGKEVARRSGAVPAAAFKQWVEQHVAA